MVIPLHQNNKHAVKVKSSRIYWQFFIFITFSFVCAIVVFRSSLLSTSSISQSAEGSHQTDTPLKNELTIQTCMEEFPTLKHSDDASLISKEKCQQQFPQHEISTSNHRIQAQPNPHQSIDDCRKMFTSFNQGGQGTLTATYVKNLCDNPGSFNVCQDLIDFTGLTPDEVQHRLERHDNFHFEGEHIFWNPQSTSELAWFYTTSVNYLFANSLHPHDRYFLNKLEAGKHEPVLDYSGGVGNNIIYLAKKGRKCQYFGIGLMEYAFAEFRIRTRNLEDHVEFVRPYSEKAGLKFDPINAVLKRDGSLGAILAMDVLEHIPNYQKVVEAMVESLKVGGVIVEISPFANDAKKGGELDLRVHVSNGGVGMPQAMGPKMKRRERGLWEKISE